MAFSFFGLFGGKKDKTEESQGQQEQAPPIAEQPMTSSGEERITSGESIVPTAEPTSTEPTPSVPQEPGVPTEEEKTSE